MIKESLQATRAQLMASLSVIDLALAQIEKQERAMRPTCSHDNKVDVSTMGNPNSWYCPKCHETSVPTTAA